jgi:hypothetical protein
VPKPLLRIVLDTSVYISAALSPNGSSGRVWRCARERRFQLITSPFIINETGRVLRRLKKENERAITQRLKEIAHLAEIVQPTTSLQVVRDPNDDPIVECAVDGKADMIVSLDKDLLTLKVYSNIPILHVVDLLHILGK